MILCLLKTQNLLRHAAKLLNTHNTTKMEVIQPIRGRYSPSQHKVITGRCRSHHHAVFLLSRIAPRDSLFLLHVPTASAEELIQTFLSLGISVGLSNS